MIDMEYVGMAAGVLTTGCFIPQAFLALRSADTKSISLLMYILFCTGVSLWFTFGILKESPALIISNGVTLILALIILGKKISNIIKKID